ncbi:hypothetical protein EXE63_01390 (plasmid) [Mycolicibacterium frederiksbergense]|uniref:Uncharacterized protein n=1 Tax=Mycolicibacterium frederiksbergense TaxID=117567 RepID=A0A6H0RZA0_9MYCO|nr:hypothetical protein EXE63_01390 [Mycolicibacterium frederiksbergense]
MLSSPRNYLLTFRPELTPLGCAEYFSNLADASLANLRNSIGAAGADLSLTI